jgi:C4-type Zn-finger protein
MRKTQPVHAAGRGLSKDHETQACPVCRMPMRLVGMEPHPVPGRSDEIYTFECSQCGMTTAEVVSKGTPIRLRSPLESLQ